MSHNKTNINEFTFIDFLKKMLIYALVLLLLFACIAFMTTITSSDRFSSAKLTNITKNIESSTFLHLIGLEGKVFRNAFPEDMEIPKLSSISFQLVTSIKPSDPRSLLGNELPGFSIFDHKVLIAEEGSYHTNHPIESAPPLEEILKDRHAVVDEEEQEMENDEPDNTTGDRDVVFIYNTHNRESFLPHLPDLDDPDKAFHKEVNITKVSDRLSKSLKSFGIGTHVDHTDIMQELNKNNWVYGRSYEASRPVVREAFADNEDIQYAFDLHRDGAPRDKTTTEINGENYARIMIVIGAEHHSYKKNLELANELHALLEKKYPGITRGEGVYPKKGAATNGIFNQDLSENALLFEMGGVENNLEELYRTADALADVFAEFYWDAEKVDG